MKRAVFLDRDGVLNQISVRDGIPRPPGDIGELEILAGVPEACSALKAAGFFLVVVTNQPDVARGTATRQGVEQINQAIKTSVPVDRFMVCYHDDADACCCRKPEPGMLLQAAAEENLDAVSSFMIGDRWRDVEAGRRAGCRTILVTGAYVEEKACQPDHQVSSLAEAAQWILKSEGVKNRDCNN